MNPFAILVDVLDDMQQYWQQQQMLQYRAAYFDVIVRNSLQESYLLESATQPRVAAAGGDSEKIELHKDEVNVAGCEFYPLVVQTLGVWSLSSLEILIF